MGAFLSTLFSIILGLYIFGFISKLILRYWLKKKIKDFEQGKSTGNTRFYGNWGNFNQQQQNNKKPEEEGSVTIKATTVQDRKIDKEIGEYVDFDEVKEDK